MTYLQTFPKTDLLLDNESQGSGVFLPELDEPEYCNAQNAALWELHALRVRVPLPPVCEQFAQLFPKQLLLPEYIMYLVLGQEVHCTPLLEFMF